MFRHGLRFLCCIFMCSLKFSFKRFVLSNIFSLKKSFNNSISILNRVMKSKNHKAFIKSLSFKEITVFGWNNTKQVKRKIIGCLFIIFCMVFGQSENRHCLQSYPKIYTDKKTHLFCRTTCLNTWVHFNQSNFSFNIPKCCKFPFISKTMFLCTAL